MTAHTRQAAYRRWRTSVARSDIYYFACYHISEIESIRADKTSTESLMSVEPCISRTQPACSILERVLPPTFPAEVVTPPRWYFYFCFDVSSSPPAVNVFVVTLHARRAFEDDQKMTLRLKCPLQQQRGGAMDPQVSPRFEAMCSARTLAGPCRGREKEIRKKTKLEKRDYGA